MTYQPWLTTLLLSLLLLSCMVVFIRELANITTTKALSTNILDWTSSSMNIDINVNTPRGRPSFSYILSKTLLILYCDRMKIQNKNFLWSKQIEAEEITQSLNVNVEKNNILDKQKTNNSFKTRKQHKVNEALALKYMLSSWDINETSKGHNLGL